MTSRSPDSPRDLRERLEEEADATRERLISDIDELTDRAQRVKDVFETLTNGAKRHKAPLIAAGVGVTALSAVLFFRHRAAVKRHERWRMLEHVALGLVGVTPPPPPEPGFLRRSLSTLGSMLAAAAVNELKQRVAQHAERALPHDANA